MIGRLQISPAFAAPVAEGRLPGCERLNRRLEGLFLARETDGYRNPTPSHLPQEEMFESRFNLFPWNWHRAIRKAVLRFMDTRPAADGYLDIAKRRLRPDLALQAPEVPLQEGQVMVFPSFAFHEVAPFYGRDTRITVATNCWFTEKATYSCGAARSGELAAPVAPVVILQQA